MKYSVETYLLNKAHTLCIEFVCSGQFRRDRHAKIDPILEDIAAIKPKILKPSKLMRSITDT